MVLIIIDDVLRARENFVIHSQRAYLCEKGHTRVVVDISRRHCMHANSHADVLNAGLVYWT